MKKEKDNNNNNNKTNNNINNKQTNITSNENNKSKNILDDSDYNTELNDYLASLIDNESLFENSKEGISFTSNLSSRSLNNNNNIKINKNYINYNSIPEKVKEVLNEDNDDNNNNNYINLFKHYIIRGSNLDIKIKKALVISCQIPFYVKFSKNDSFGIIQCENILTYFLGNFSISQISNPYFIVEHYKLKIKILERNFEKNMFLLSNNNNINNDDNNNNIDNINDNNINDNNNNNIIEKVEYHKLIKFLEETNKIVNNNEILNIIKNIKNKKIMYIINIIIIFLCIVLISFLLCININKLIKKKEKKNKILLIIFLIILIICLILEIKFYLLLKGLNFLKRKKIIIYRIRHIDDVNLLMKKYNEELFIKHHIRIWIPYSLDYILFNYDLFQDIKIEQHILEEKKQIK